MKKVLSVIMAAVMCAILAAGCAAAPAEPINVTALKGPTGMGMTSLLGEEYADKYSVTLSGAPDEVTASIISGETDIAAVPINLASVLYNKTEGDLVMLAVNTLGVLYILDANNEITSVEDLAGKTLYATGQGSTPEYMLDYVLNAYGLKDSVTVEYKAEHSEVATLMAAGEVTLAMLPEPNVTSVLFQNENAKVALSITELWESASGTAPVQGCIVARRSFVEENKKAVEQFLEDYKASVEFVNSNKDAASTLIETYGIVPKAAIAKAAIDNCNIVFVVGEEMQEMTDAMLKVLHDANPKSVGGKLPGTDFYYEG